VSLITRWRAARRLHIRATTPEEKAAAEKQLAKLQAEMTPKQLASVRDEYHGTC
jgi:hypothetical protein